MTTRFEEFEAYRSFSLMTPKPVLFGELCFWNGLFMSKRTAFTLCSKFFMAVPVTPSMKEALWDATYEALAEAKSFGYEPPFDLNDYSPERMFKYLYATINVGCQPQKSPALAEWKDDFRKCIEHFFVDQ